MLQTCIRICIGQRKTIHFLKCELGLETTKLKVLLDMPSRVKSIYYSPICDLEVHIPDNSGLHDNKRDLLNYDAISGSVPVRRHVVCM